MVLDRDERFKLEKNRQKERMKLFRKAYLQKLANDGPERAKAFAEIVTRDFDREFPEVK